MKKRLSHQSRLMIERLEQRQLLAADLLDSQSQFFHDDPGDSSVSADFQLTADEGDGGRLERRPGEGRRRRDVTPAAPAEFRSFDGTGNNLLDPELGSTDEPLLRTAPADYSDQTSAPAGESRPSAREISNALSAQGEPIVNDRQTSAFIYVWGQFLDHDIDLTPTQDENGEALPIGVPAGDPLFDPDNTGAQVIPFFRSQFDETTGLGSPRQQINAITAWIDGSMIYGSDPQTADSLREFVGGRLLVGADNLLPTDSAGRFLAGDVRVNENIELTTMHTLFVREHNNWADRIAAENPALTDEQVYQQARAIVVAEIQAITYHEFLPALLGQDALTPYSGYDATVDPTIANEFSTAAFRFGHSTLNDDVEFFGDDGRAVRDEVELRDAFMNPDLLRETGIDSILKYVASSQSQEIDLQVVDSLRNFLFGAPGQGGLDLAALNIQRGRDHGLADYNSVREAYGLPRVESFADITSNPEVQQQLASVYQNVDDIDLWVGGLAEDHVAGSSLGATFQAIIADQFQRLRDGDRLWFQNAFSGAELQLEQTRLSDIIQRNTTVSNLQQDVFFFRASVAGQVFADANGNGRQDRGEDALAGVTVQLLGGDGELVAATETDRRGRFLFDEFSETGDYQLQVEDSVVEDILISSGDQQIRDLDLGVSLIDQLAAAVANDFGSRKNSGSTLRVVENGRISRH